jgi:hypothetical protein
MQFKGARNPIYVDACRRLDGSHAMPRPSLLAPEKSGVIRTTTSAVGVAEVVLDPSNRVKIESVTFLMWQSTDIWQRPLMFHLVEHFILYIRLPRTASRCRSKSNPCIKSTFQPRFSAKLPTQPIMRTTKSYRSERTKSCQAWAAPKIVGPSQSWGRWWAAHPPRSARPCLHVR